MTLRSLDDEIGLEVARVAAAGVHDPSWTPFLTPWTDVSPGELGPNMFRYWWRSRAETGPERWTVNFAVIVDGEVVGACGLAAEQFSVLGSFETGSWLGLEFQGRGIGREMREASLHLGFAGLDAQFATTGAFGDNPTSLAVTARLGYTPTGRRRVVRRGVPAELHDFRMPRQHWETIRRDDIELIGVDGVRHFLAIS